MRTQVTLLKQTITATQVTNPSIRSQQIAQRQAIAQSRAR